MWEKIDSFVRENDMLADGDAILVGLSGGADSVLLLWYLLAAREKMQIRLFALHINHLLRGEEAERDEAFAGELCAKWQVPFAAVKKEVAAEAKRRHCSLEEAGRLVRYDCFATFAEKWNCNKIAVAHHKNDLAETVLFRMARGTGIRGLSGIRPVNGALIRPLLCLEKEEIVRMLQALGQSYEEDSSNRDDSYSRNYIRLRLLPDLQAVNARAVEHLGQLSGQAAELMDYLEPVFEKIFGQTVVCLEDALLLPKEAAARLHPVERKETARRMLAQMAGSQRDITALHVEQLLSLLDKKAGKYRELPYGLTAERTEKGVLLMRREAWKKRQRQSARAEESAVRWVDMERLERTGSQEILLPGTGHISFQIRPFQGGYIEKNDCVKYFDYDKIKSTLCLRSRKAGDYFVVDKEGRHKTLRRYFIDEKVPAGERDTKILLAEGSHILWVTGGRISEAYRVEPDTRRVLVVRTEKHCRKRNGGKTMADKISVLIPEEKVIDKIKELGERISTDYAGKEVHLICILKGGVFFACELAKHITVPVSLDFMQVSSYGNATSSSGIVRIKKDLDDSMEGKEVIIVEDIIDSGRTLHYLIPVLKQRNPESIRLCALLNKPDRREVDVQIDYLGFDIPDEFVVGYGLDYAQKYRNLPFIGIVEPDVSGEEAEAEPERKGEIVG